MSYNPAFVADESPLVHCASAVDSDRGESNGIKLTSFKPLKSAAQDGEQRLTEPSGKRSTHKAKTSGDQHEHLRNYGLNHHHQDNNHHQNHKNNNNNNNDNNNDNHNQDHDHNHDHQHHHHHHHHHHLNHSHSHSHHHHHQNKSHNNSRRHPERQKSPSQNFLLSTSSSLSLIDNPTLSSLATTAATGTSNTSATNSAFESSSYSPSSASSQASSLVTTNGALCAAVECRDMRYAVGRGKNAKTILHDINVTVPEGSIYGLLGPSGCGKTTMLRCVVGRIKPRSGQVRVFGYQPNEAGSQIPGPAIGYMPQEISVYEDFTINETLTYFGKINKMKQDLIDARIQFLLNFLDLPGKNRLIASLSGGQKRRVSLAAALVHSPPLLILDEPTVGVDPLLRQSIWKHLVTLAQSEKITVVITTHYIEEARQANVVGLMRNGKLLAEDSPDNLMAQHGMDNLEDVFLKLCISDSSRKAAKLAATLIGQDSLVAIEAGRGPKRIKVAGGAQEQRSSVLLDANGLQIMPRMSTKLGGIVDGCCSSSGSLSSERVKAKRKRHIPSVFALGSGKLADDGAQDGAATDRRAKASVTMMEPADGGRSVALGISGGAGESETMPDFVVNKNNLRSMVPGTKYAPKKLSYATWSKSLLAVIWKNFIRLKRNPPVLIFEFILPAVQVILFCLCIGGDPFDVPLAVVNDEVIPQASRFFLDAIDKKAIRQVPFSNLSEAIESVRRGETWGAIHIPDRYTQYLQERLTHPADITNDTLTNGTINIYPDLTNLHLALAMENTFREAFIKFAKDTLNMFGYDPEAAELPIRVEEPVYGTLKRNGYLEFMAPGVVISITYVMATGLTALAFILEKRDGLLERSLVSGVTTSQILLAHASVQVLVMIIQIALVLAFTFFVFEIPSHGPFFWVILLILLQGCTGMSFGLLVSSICEEENTAVMMLVGTFYTNLILAGIIWPLEAMPHWLRWLSYAQPQTLPTETLRNILSRGWGIGETGVYVGFLVTIGWLIVFLMAAGLFMRYSK